MLANRMSWVSMLIPILLASNLLSSCKTRCTHTSIGCESDKGLLRSTLSSQMLPWQVSMPAQALLEQSNAIYLELYDRFLKSPDGQFPVPEFLPATQQIESYFQEFTLLIPADRSPQRDWGLFKPKPNLVLFPTLELNAAKQAEIVRRYLKAFPNSDEEYISQRLSKGLQAVNNISQSYNRTATQDCLKNRSERWKQITFPNSPESLTYANFWRGFHYFSKSISVSCGKEIPESELDRTGQYASFPSFLLPSFLREGSIEEFNAIAHLPLYWVGVIDAVALVDDLPRNPDIFVLHDLAHAKESLDRSWKEKLKFFIQPSAMDGLSDIGKSEASYFNISMKIGKTPPSEILTLLRSKDDIGQTLASFQKLNICVHAAISRHDQATQLASALFEMTHEDPVFLANIPESKVGSLARVDLTTKRLLDDIITVCRNQSSSEITP